MGINHLGLALSGGAAASLLADLTAGFSHTVTLLRSMGVGQLEIEAAAFESAEGEGISGGASGQTSGGARGQTSGGASGSSTSRAAARLRSVAAVASRSGWNVLLSIDLAHLRPTAAALSVAAARGVLRRRLSGVQIGREPNRFTSDGLRPKGFGPAAYAAELAEYERDLTAAAPGVPMLAPDVALSFPGASRWLRAAAGARPAELSAMLAQGGDCTHPLQAVLTEAHDDEALIEHFASLARELHLSGQLELQGRSCGASGRAAEALWATSLIGQALHAGIAHVLLAGPVVAGQPTGPLIRGREAHSPAAADVQPGAEWYAMLLTSRLAGEWPLHASLHSTGDGEHQIHAQAFEGRSGAVHLLLEDEEKPGSRPFAVRIVIPRQYRKGAILRLTGDARSSSGVALGGAEVSRSGRWRAHLPLPAVYGPPSALSVEMTPSSAALVTLTPTQP